LSSVDDRVFGLAQLKTLILDNNKLSSLPDVPRVLCVALAALALEHNALSTLPACLAQCSNLRRVTLQGNAFGKLPSVLFALPNLAFLDLSENDLGDDDAWDKFPKLAQLQTLLLDANELRGIPSGLFGLLQLAKLSLKHNYITGVPARVAELVSLQELYLNNNKITKVPIHVYRLPKLRCVLLSGNPMDLNAKAKRGSVGTAASSSDAGQARTPWDALGAARRVEESSDDYDKATRSAPLAASGKSLSGSGNNSGTLSTSGKSMPMFVGNQDDDDDDTTSGSEAESGGSASLPPIDVAAAKKLPIEKAKSSPTSPAKAAAAPPPPTSAASVATVTPASPTEKSSAAAAAAATSSSSLSAESSPMQVDGKQAKRSLASKLGGMFRGKKHKNELDGAPALVSSPSQPMPTSTVSGAAAAAAAAAATTAASVTDATSPRAAGDSGWLHGSSKLAREAAEKFDREHGLAAAAVPPIVEPLDLTKAKKKRAPKEPTPPVPPLPPARHKSEPAAEALLDEKAIRRRSAKLERKARQSPLSPKAFTLKASHTAGDDAKAPSGASSPARATLKSSPARAVLSGKADDLLKAHKTPRVKPFVAVRVPPKVQKSRFFMELRQENDPALSQVSLEETAHTIFVQSAPVHALVLLLSHAWGFDAKFQSQFLASMRAFVQPVELLDMLQRRYDAHAPLPSDGGRAGERTAVRERILSFLDEWFTTLPSEIIANRVLRKNLVDFLRAAMRLEAQHRSQSALADRADRLLQSVRAYLQAESTARERALDEHKAMPVSSRVWLGDAIAAGSLSTSPRGSSASAALRTSASSSAVDPADAPPTPQLPSPRLDPLHLTFVDLHPVEVARQLTLIDHGLLRRTRLGEWFDCSWTGNAAAEEAPTVVALVNFFNGVSRWVTTAIVSAPDLESRVVLLKRFLIVAHACAELHNFNGVMQILSGVEAFAVQRLRKTWAALPKQSHKLYDDLCELVAIDDGDIAAFRQRLATCALPCLPYIGPYLTGLQLLDESSPSFSETGDVNFEKLAAKADIVLDIKVYMDARFNLAPVDVVQSFLRAQPLTSDDELTKLSLAVEPLASK
jgi:hypothetical protein